MLAVIFDFDGLLAPTETTSLSSWEQLWAWHGLELDLSGFWLSDGSDPGDLRHARLAAAVGPGYDRASAEAHRQAVRARLHADLVLCPGIANRLEEAAGLGLRLAVASSSPRSWVEPLLAQLDVRDRFEVLCCGDQVAKPKPDPGVYLLALARLGLDAGQALAVEDSPHGVHAAQAAGLRCVAIPNPHVDPARLAHADLLLTSATEFSLRSCLTLQQRGRAPSQPAGPGHPDAAHKRQQVGDSTAPLTPATPGARVI